MLVMLWRHLSVYFSCLYCCSCTNKHNLSSHSSADATAATILVPSKGHEGWTELHQQARCSPLISRVLSVFILVVLSEGNLCMLVIHTHTLLRRQASAPLFTLDLSSLDSARLSGHYISAGQRRDLSVREGERAKEHIRVCPMFSGWISLFNLIEWW